MARSTMCSALMLAALSAAACGRTRLASRREWPDEAGLSMEPKDPAPHRHLLDDAEAPETLALRYADLQEGPGNCSQRPETWPEMTRPPTAPR